MELVLQHSDSRHSLVNIVNLSSDLVMSVVLWVPLVLEAEAIVSEPPIVP